MVAFEQLLELDSLYLFEFAPQVVDIREQPFKLSYAMGNKIRRYTPDYALTFRDGSVLVVEVKPERSLAKPEVREKLLHVQESMARQGHQFIVLSSASIRAPHRLDNLKQLHRYLRQSLPLETRRTLRQFKDRLAGQPLLTLDGLTQALGSPESVALHLLAHGELSCDLDQPLTLNTLITLTKQEADYVFVNSL